MVKSVLRSTARSLNILIGQTMDAFDDCYRLSLAGGEGPERNRMELLVTRYAKEVEQRHATFTLSTETLVQIVQHRYGPDKEGGPADVDGYVRYLIAEHQRLLTDPNARGPSRGGGGKLQGQVVSGLDAGVVGRIEKLASVIQAEYAARAGRDSRHSAKGKSGKHSAQAHGGRIDAYARRTTGNAQRLASHVAISPLSTGIASADDYSQGIRSAVAGPREDGPDGADEEAWPIQVIRSVGMFTIIGGRHVMMPVGIRLAMRMLGDPEDLAETEEEEIVIRQAKTLLDEHTRATESIQRQIDALRVFPSFSQIIEGVSDAKNTKTVHARADGAALVAAALLTPAIWGAVQLTLSFFTECWKPNWRFAVPLTQNLLLLVVLSDETGAVILGRLVARSLQADTDADERQRTATIKNGFSIWADNRKLVRLSERRQEVPFVMQVYMPEVRVG